MNKTIDTVFRLAFTMFFLALVAGIYLLATGSTLYQQVVIVGSLASGVIIAASIYEVATTKGMGRGEKAAWIVAFVLFNVLAALVYFLVRRSRHSIFK